jgi:hypothetical protein
MGRGRESREHMRGEREYHGVTEQRSARLIPRDDCSGGRNDLPNLKHGTQLTILSTNH